MISYFSFQDEFLFLDAEMVDIPEPIHQKKLIFTFNSEGKRFMIVKDMFYLLIFRYKNDS
jgi:hypothetical protein